MNVDDVLQRRAVGDTEIAYVDEGSGRPVVFIHGLGCDHRLMAPQITHFRTTHRAIAPDVRGNGRSGALSGPIRTVLDRQCDDIAALLSLLGIDRTVLCGVSYGGVFGFHFALRHPERVAGLVVVDSFSDARPHSPAQLGAVVGSWFLPALFLPRRALAASVRASMRKWPAAADAVVACFDRWRPVEAARQRAAINLANHTPGLASMTCPTLGVYGAGSKVIERYMRRAFDRLPDARLERVDDSFDPTTACQPERFNALLGAFLDELAW